MSVIKFPSRLQGRIQDFEMGGEFCSNVREIKYYFNIWEIRKKKKEGGSEKGGWKFTRFTSPGSAPATPSVEMFLCVCVCLRIVSLLNIWRRENVWFLKYFVQAVLPAMVKNSFDYVGYLDLLCEAVWIFQSLQKRSPRNRQFRSTKMSNRLRESFLWLPLRNYDSLP